MGAIESIRKRRRGRLLNNVLTCMLAVSLVIGLMPSTSTAVEAVQSKDVAVQDDTAATISESSEQESPAAEPTNAVVDQQQATSESADPAVAPQAVEQPKATSGQETTSDVAAEPQDSAEQSITPQATDSSIDLNQTYYNDGDVLDWNTDKNATGVIDVPYAVANDGLPHTIVFKVPTATHTIVNYPPSIGGDASLTPTVSDDGSTITYEIPAGKNPTGSIQIGWASNKTGAQETLAHTGSLPEGIFSAEIKSGEDVQVEDHFSISYSNDAGFTIGSNVNVAPAIIHQHEGVIPPLSMNIQLYTLCTLDDTCFVDEVKVYAPAGFEFENSAEYTKGSDAGGNYLVYTIGDYVKSPQSDTGSTVWNKNLFLDKTVTITKVGAWAKGAYSISDSAVTVYGTTGDDPVDAMEPVHPGSKKDSIVYYECIEGNPLETTVTYQNQATPEIIVAQTAAGDHETTNHFTNRISGYTHYYGNQSGDDVTVSFTYPYEVQPSSITASTVPFVLNYTVDGVAQGPVTVAAGDSFTFPALGDNKNISNVSYTFSYAPAENGYDAGEPNVVVMGRPQDALGVNTNGKTYEVKVDVTQPSTTYDESYNTYYQIKTEETDCEWSVAPSSEYSYTAVTGGFNLNTKGGTTSSLAWRPAFKLSPDNKTVTNISLDEMMWYLDGTFTVPSSSTFSMVGWDVTYATKNHPEGLTYRINSANVDLALEEGDSLTGSIVFQAPGWAPCNSSGMKITYGFKKDPYTPSGEVFEGPKVTWDASGSKYDRLTYKLEASHQEAPYCTHETHWDWNPMAIANFYVMRETTPDFGYAGTTSSTTYQGATCGANTIKIVANSFSYRYVDYNNIYIQLLDDTYFLTGSTFTANVATKTASYAGGSYTSDRKGSVVEDSSGNKWLKIPGQWSQKWNGMTHETWAPYNEITFKDLEYMVPAGHALDTNHPLFGNVVVEAKDSSMEDWTDNDIMTYHTTNITTDTWGLTGDTTKKNMISFGSDVVHNVNVLQNESIIASLSPGVGETYVPNKVTYHDYDHGNLSALLSLAGGSGEKLNDGQAIITLIGKDDSTSVGGNTYNATGGMHLTGPVKVVDNTAEGVAYKYEVGGNWVTEDQVTDWSAVTRIDVTCTHIDSNGALNISLPLKSDCEVAGELGYLQADYSYKVNESATVSNSSQVATFERAPVTAKKISGYIFKDNNADGIYTSGTDTPLNGVAVRLMKDGAQVAIATTTSTGQYTFNNVVEETGLTLEVDYVSDTWQMAKASDDKLGNRFTETATNIAGMTLANPFLTDYTTANCGFVYEEPIEISFEATKYLNGVLANGTTDKFDFQLAGTGIPEATPLQASNDANGKVSFKVNASALGQYEYTMTEVPGTVEGLLYDDSEYTFKVSVGNGVSGLKVSSFKVFKDGKEVGSDSVVFNNGEQVTKTFKKTWSDENNQDGLRPDNVMLQIQKEVTGGDPVDVGDPIELNATNSWQVAKALPKYDENGEVSYTATEVDVPEDYTLSVAADGDTITLTNTHTPEVADVVVTKNWADGSDQDGLRPDKVSVQLKADNVAVGNKVEITGTGDTWTYTFKDMPKKAAGADITYTVEEDAVTDYTTTYNGLAITNTHTPKVADVVVTKNWADGSDQDGLRPDKVSVQLKADNVAVGNKVEITGTGDTWTYTFKDMPKKAAGADITYTVEEDAVADYTTTYNGLTITNAHTPKAPGEVFDITGYVKWVDENDADGIRPAKVVLRLLDAQGNKVRESEVTAADNWQVTWTNLAKKSAKAGYTVEQDAVPGYTLTYDQANYTAIDTHVVEAEPSVNDDPNKNESGNGSGTGSTSGTGGSGVVGSTGSGATPTGTSQAVKGKVLAASSAKTADTNHVALALGAVALGAATAISARRKNKQKRDN